MPLVQSLTVVGKHAAVDLRSPPQLHFQPPIRVRQRLARRADDIRLPAPQDPLGLVEAVDAAGGNHRRGKTRRAHRLPDLLGTRNVTTEGTGSADVDGGHALKPALTGVGVSRLADPWLLGVLELPAAG